MDTMLDLLASEASGSVLIDNYTSDGLMMFDGNTLWFVAGLYSGTDGKAYYNRKIVSSLLIRTGPYNSSKCKLLICPFYSSFYLSLDIGEMPWERRYTKLAFKLQKLCIDPPLPSDEKFNAMSVNRNGSRVALSSAHSVFVIEIPYDCWCRQSVTQNPVMDHLQSIYHCK